jgi:uncharacterized protein (UPF0179 family)
VYLCPNGKQLRLNARGARAGRFQGKRYEARKADCQGCPLARQCLKKEEAGRKLYIVESTVERDWLGVMRQ